MITSLSIWVRWDLYCMIHKFYLPRKSRTFSKHFFISVTVSSTNFARFSRTVPSQIFTRFELLVWSVLLLLFWDIFSHSFLPRMWKLLKGLNYPPCALLQCTSNPLAIASGMTNIEQVLAVRTKTTERNGGKIPETRRWNVRWSWLRARIENNQMWIICLYVYFLLVLMLTVFLIIIIQLPIHRIIYFSIYSICNIQCSNPFLSSGSV